MTVDKMKLAVDKYKGSIPGDEINNFKRHLEDLPDKCFDDLMELKMKSRLAILLFSILLGRFGVDRFYLGYISHGVWKIILTAFPTMISTLGTVVANDAETLMKFTVASFILSIPGMIWQFVDIFVLYREVKRYNYENVFLEFTRFVEYKSKNYYQTRY